MRYPPGDHRERAPRATDGRHLGGSGHRAELVTVGFQPFGVSGPLGVADPFSVAGPHTKHASQHGPTAQSDPDAYQQPDTCCELVAHPDPDAHNHPDSHPDAHAQAQPDAELNAEEAAALRAGQGVLEQQRPPGRDGQLRDLGMEHARGEHRHDRDRERRECGQRGGPQVHGVSAT